MPVSKEQLAQTRENSTNAVSIYSPSAIYSDKSSDEVEVEVWLCNVSGAQVTARLFHDDDGTTYDESTALMWDASIPVGKTLKLCGILMGRKTGQNLAYQPSVANAITATVYGEREHQ